MTSPVALAPVDPLALASALIAAPSVTPRLVEMTIVPALLPTVTLLNVSALGVNAAGTAPQASSVLA